MTMQIDVEVQCDASGCRRIGFSGSYYTFSEIRAELKADGWSLKRRGDPINKWWYFCPDCQSDDVITDTMGKRHA